MAASRSLRVFLFCSIVALIAIPISAALLPQETTGSATTTQSTPPEPAESSSTNSPDGKSPNANEPVGIDQKIDSLFEPVAKLTGAVVLVSTPGFAGIPPIPVVVLILVLGASYFTIYFGFVNIRRFWLAIQTVMGKFDKIENVDNPIPEKEGSTVEHQGEVSHFQALATAVSGTVGLGNIAGVAVAVAVGGPGATFWMIVCGVLGMSTKFVECTLGVTFRDIEPNGTVHGGPMYYLSKGLAGLGFAQFGKFLGVLFAILCVGASLGGGNMFQANQCTKQLQTMMGLSSQGASGFIIGIVMALLVAVVVIGGIKRIASVTDKLVPLMAIIYIVAGLVIIVLNIGSVPSAISEIITGAFSPSAAVGGFIGVIIVGFKRAAFSNEAGAGSAAIAHSAVHTKYPASEGIVSLLEPFIDTVVICTITALIIVLYNTNDEFVYGKVVNDQVAMLKDGGTMIGGVDLTSRAFDAAIPNFRYVLTIAVILFAFSTMISWSYYGLTAWKYLFGRSKFSDISYKLMFCIFVVVGSASSLKNVIDFSDAMILALVFPNMIGLFLLAPRVKKELNEYLALTSKFIKSSK
jgi:alanine or glycine:cation symporter, AGCS family